MKDLGFISVSTSCCYTTSLSLSLSINKMWIPAVATSHSFCGLKRGNVYKVAHYSFYQFFYDLVVSFVGRRNSISVATTSLSLILVFYSPSGLFLPVFSRNDKAEWSKELNIRPVIKSYQFT